MRRAVVVFVAFSIATAVASCGLSDPYQAADDRPATSTTPRVVDNEVRPTVPYREDRTPSAPSATRAEAIAAFGELYINWTYTTLTETRRRLADVAVGAASAAQRRAAAQTSSDYELRRGRVENHGQVVSIAPERGTGGDRWVVVTRETTTGSGTYAGLPPAYHVTLVTVDRVDGGYAVSVWEPQV